MMNVKEIRTFCLARPRPAKIRATLYDGTVNDIAPPKPPASWAQVAETIAAIEPKLIEALDDKDALMRAKRDEDEPEDEPQHKFKPSANITDPETQRLTHFANHLANAYRFSTEVAFNKLAEMFAEQKQDNANTTRRLELLEAKNRRLDSELVQAEIEAAHAAGVAAGGGTEGGQGSFIEQMAMSFLQGKMQGENDAKTTNGVNGKPNGKGRPS